MDDSAELEPSPTVASLQSRIKTLTALAMRVAELRRAPAILLRPATASSGFNTGNADDLVRSLTGDIGSAKPLADQFTRIKEIMASILAEDIQIALRGAQESVKADPNGIIMGEWRQGRAGSKREWQPSPESPQPYQHFRPKPNTPFPSIQDPSDPITADTLTAYIKTFNRTPGSSNAKLHIWRSTKRPTSSSKAQPVGAEFGDTILLRLLIPDVLIAFIVVENYSRDRPLVVESLNCFGPREKKAPHLQSDWLVFQQLSQELAKVVRSQPRASLQQLVGLISAYHNLFYENCARCGALLRSSGHMPPLVRKWADEPLANTPSAPTLDPDVPSAAANNEALGCWEPLHLECARK